MKMSERFATSPIFVGLKMDPTGTIRDDTRGSPKFTDLKNALLSKDDAVYGAYHAKWLADGQLRFLDGAPLDGERTMYNSF